MALEVIWTQEAKDRLTEIISYLETYWEEKQLKQFASQLEKKLSLISEHPQMYRESIKLEGARECILDKYNTLLYTYDKVCIYVLTIWDNRQNPDRRN